MKLFLSFLYIVFITSLGTVWCQNPVVVVIGTRPEGIKMIPVYQALQELHIPTLLCATGQHTHLLTDTFKTFGIEPDINLNIMKPGQDLFYITSIVLEKMKEFLQETKPCLVLVQGDTTSAMASALAAFYLKIPVGHVEAGLRTGNKYGPFPEEVNRQIISAIATYHFAPTVGAVDNLCAENIDKAAIFCTGNTVVDALHFIQNQIRNNTISTNQTLSKQIASLKTAGKKLMLLTAHRRESFDGGLIHIFNALEHVLQQHPELYVIYPMHPNPAIKAALDQTTLGKNKQILIIEPLPYTDLVYLLEHADLIATDSGGIQEEAVSLSKPVIVLRNETDRMEGIQQGLAHLVGCDEEKIINHIDSLLSDTKIHNQQQLYGDGTAGKQIATIIHKLFFKEIL